MASLDFPCTAHAFFPERLSNHCQGLHHTFSEICTKCCPFVGSIAKSHQANTQLQTKDVKNQYPYPTAWNFVHCLPGCTTTIIYRCIALKLLYRWKNPEIMDTDIHKVGTGWWRVPRFMLQPLYPQC
jgi:hypothetical protein